MCGKFLQLQAWLDLVTLVQMLDAVRIGQVEIGTPMRFARIIALDDGGVRRSVPMRWGLIPPWEKDQTRFQNTIHARAETIDQKKSFKNAFARQRGLLVVKTFNEGKELPNGKTQQFTITPHDGNPIGIAVIWERWGEPHGGMLLTFAMVTVPANTLIGTITDRMPAVLPPEQWAKWLGEEPASPEELKSMLKPFEGDWDMQPQSPPPKPGRPDPQPSLF
ncbi:MAG: SOS response-associated peptidase [Alphaproteobacteria bacterium]|nr:SOS response-associated peptidase [Alphaproteobacteria bacterium]